MSLDFAHEGDLPLSKPSNTTIRPQIDIGDVGYIKPVYGYFVCLFTIHWEPNMDRANLSPDYSSAMCRTGKPGISWDGIDHFPERKKSYRSLRSSAGGATSSTLGKPILVRYDANKWNPGSARDPGKETSEMENEDGRAIGDGWWHDGLILLATLSVDVGALWLIPPIRERQWAMLCVASSAASAGVGLVVAGLLYISAKDYMYDYPKGHTDDYYTAHSPLAVRLLPLSVFVSLTSLSISVLLVVYRQWPKLAITVCTAIGLLIALQPVIIAVLKITGVLSELLRTARAGGQANGSG
ncbi:hypothetical protein PENSPDRAFT_650399 [Peniophora sp. CONT]|nr:hypothetical protein PENSPDRAFT_650399 [Peniophora sp. CONT]